MSIPTNKSVIKKLGSRGPRNPNVHTHDIPSQKIKFQSSDSQGSDISYQSSIGSDEDIQLGRVQYFKEEMARFFINYPELINEDIIEKQRQNFISQVQKQNKQQMATSNRKFTVILNQKQKEQQILQKYKTKDHWGPIAHDIIKQAKESSTSLDAIAKRITLYRNKVDQQDLIDILLKQQSHILKEIDDQIKEKKFQSNEGRLNFNHDRVSKQNSSAYGGDTVFYSWKKKRQAQLKKMNSSLHQQQIKRNNSTHKNTTVSPKQKHKITQSLIKTQYQSFKSPKNQNGKNQQLKNGDKVDQQISKQSGLNLSNAKPSLFKNKSVYHQNKLNSQNRSNSIQSQNIPNPVQNKHVLNFEPKTQAGKQLYEEIKRHNPNDDLNIKKTIITFLSKHRQNMQKQVVSKSTLSQKINKLYSEDSKQLVMFYPASRNQANQQRQREKTGIGYGTGISAAGNYNDFSASVETDSIMNVLKEICEGPLMKYWKELQQKKL